MIDVSKAQSGDYWSNVEKTGLFKNYGPVVQNPSRSKDFLKFFFRGVCCHPKPQKGYKDFFKTWHVPCTAVQRLEQLLKASKQSGEDESEKLTETLRIHEKKMGTSLSQSGSPKDRECDKRNCSFGNQSISEDDVERKRGVNDLVCWLGHASQLLCIVEGNVNILFDPIFSLRASPLWFVGPKRKFPPPLQISELPPIDLVLISHNHYDHLDKYSILSLYKRFPWVQFVVPLKMETLLVPWGIPSSRIISLDWWEEVEIRVQRRASMLETASLNPTTVTLKEVSSNHSKEGERKLDRDYNSSSGGSSSIHLRIAATPAQHYGLHSLTDRNKVLWCGWCLGWKLSAAPISSLTPLGSLLRISTPLPPSYPEDEVDQMSHRSESVSAMPAGAVSSSPTVKVPEDVTCTSEIKRTNTPSLWNWNAADMKTYFFTGDTSFNREIFEQIHFHYPRISMAGLPIGAYSPRKLLHVHHIDPESAVEIFKIMHIQRSYGVHWGTFDLGLEPMDEPPVDLRERLGRKDLSCGGLEEVEEGKRVFHVIPTGGFLEF